MRLAPPSTSSCSARMCTTPGGPSGTLAKQRRPETMGFSEFVALLPPPLQFMAYVFAAGVSYFLVRTEYRKRRDTPPATSSTDLIVAGGSITDMKPIRELNDHLQHLVTHTAAATIEQR